MTRQQQQPDAQPVVIAGNCRFVGELFIEGSAIIHGQVEGKIEVTDTLEIGEDGCINGIVRASAVAVHGRIEGEIYCTDALHLGATANLAGDVFAAAFSAEEGATCRGQVVIGQQAVAAARASRGAAGGLTAPEANDEPIAMRVDQDMPSVEATSVSTSPNAARSLLRRRPSILSSGRGAAG